MKRRLVPLLFLLCALLNAQSFLNLNFQQTTGNLPTGWGFGGGNFAYVVDTTTNYNSTQSLRISSLTSDTSAYGAASIGLSAGPAVGQTFHLTGAIRTQAVNGYASLWANVSDSQYNTVAFQDLHPSVPSGTTGWQVYSISLQVPASAANITFGVLLSGTGTAWFDDLSIDIDGSPSFTSGEAGNGRR